MVGLIRGAAHEFQSIRLDAADLATTGVATGATRGLGVNGGGGGRV
jgi:hypothetical protein